MIWYSEKNDNDIIVSTRIRIARNLKKYNFPDSICAEDVKNINEEVKNAIFNSNSVIAGNFEFFEISKMSPIERNALTEQHFISPALMNSKIGSVLIDHERTTSIMINEEDHIRLQVILAGLKLKEAWDIADKVDDLIEENAEYAFDEKFGYLTACPTNLGTGLRASVMMHLPALTMTGAINEITSSAGGLGIAIRGIYGEGSQALGNLYQISNQVTMGIDEEDIITKVENISKQIENYEREARANLLKNNKSAVENRVWCSYGILKYARELTSKEAKARISDVILGKAMDIITENINSSLIELMVETEPALIAKGKELLPEQRDYRRAEVIRSAM